MPNSVATVKRYGRTVSLQNMGALSPSIEGMAETLNPLLPYVGGKVDFNRSRSNGKFLQCFATVVR